ncbi:uncharacterized protein ASCRUDRAFT_29353, partial [Ascoidea rubescens DSM 1968]
WWLKNNELPSDLIRKVGNNLIFEVEENEIIKRGNRKFIYRDYYILFANYSQLVISISFDSKNPQITVNMNQSHISPPIINDDILNKYYDLFGNTIYQLAIKSIGSIIYGDFVPGLLSQIPNILRPVGATSFGAQIYFNNSNSQISKKGDFRPGDILTLEKAKFNAHNKFHQKFVFETGFDKPFSAIITDWDNKKEKFRVIEKSSNTGKIKQSSYRPSDLKSGTIRVFRTVGRDFVQW